MSATTPGAGTTPAPGTPDVEHARRVVAGNALDSQDARLLLDMLGLLPNQAPLRSTRRRRKTTRAGRPRPRGTCPVCREDRPTRLDHTLVNHLSGGDYCPGSGQLSLEHAPHTVGYVPPERRWREWRAMAREMHAAGRTTSQIAASLLVDVETVTALLGLPSRTLGSAA